MNKYKYFALALAALLCLASCNKTEPDDPAPAKGSDMYYVNLFSYNMMNVYYLWSKEIRTELQQWRNKITDDPISKVGEIRYKNPVTGKEIDKWTMLTDDFSSFSSSVAGFSTTYGFDFLLSYGDSSRKSVVAVVTLAYKGTPADKAGIRRGDIITKMNGRSMTADNYEDVITDEMFCCKSCSFGFIDGSSTASLIPTDMYEDPVFESKVFDCNGKKVGYLFYNSFTQRSYERLKEEFARLKEAGVSELILDMRYNGGGYVTTEYALASMIVPEKEVLAGSVFETEVHNENVSKSLGGRPEVRFTTEFSYLDGTDRVKYSTQGFNLGIDKLYAIVTGNSASASESLITGLLPYMDVEIIGEQTYGKYCSGIMLDGPSWFDIYEDDLKSEDIGRGRKATENWGIYVMYSRYADKDGNTPCMPDGFIPDISVQDYPFDGYQLGDPEETMLCVALSRAGYVSGDRLTASSKAGRSAEKENLLPSGEQIRRPEFGLRIIEPQSLPKGQVSPR